jgi:multiple sugar transport system substrate-binding protein
MTAAFRGLTWDHPRGRSALEAAASVALADDGRPLIEWEAQPLEGFESTPIARLADRYDVIVLDHPHLGDALAAEAIRPLDDWFDPALLRDLSSSCVGPSYRSYVIGDRPWALPLDAATQVSASIPDAVDRLPVTWSQVVDLAGRAPVALSLAGPHAFLTFASVCVALGAEPATEPGRGFVDGAVGKEAIGLLRRIAERTPAAADALNPIGLLERMRTERDIAYIPLVYGYVNYASGPGALRFGDAPSSQPEGRHGSTIGGTGIALTTRSEPSAALIGHLSALLDRAAQTRFIPDNDGQPSFRSAWDDPRLNAAAGDFYRRTRATIEDAWVRPRVPGFVPFQSRASALIREAVTEHADIVATLRRIDALFDELAALATIYERAAG